jgi:hypothetical protein
VTTRTNEVEIRDLERPTLMFVHQKSVTDDDGAVPPVITALVNDPKEHIAHEIYEVLINKVNGSPVEWCYELFDHLYYYWPPDQIEGSHTDDGMQHIFSANSIHTPYDALDVNVYDDNYYIYGPIRPYMWTHLEVSGTVFVQGILFTRTTNAGDDFRRTYLNGVPWTAAVAAIVGATETDLLGMAYIPCADRLNDTEV